MKRFVMIFSALLAVSSAAVIFAAPGPGGLTGIGVYGSFGSAAGTLGGGVGVSLKWASFPVVGSEIRF